jgi:Domain of unknown function (DUF5668)
MRRARTLEGPYVLIAIGILLLLWNFGYIPRGWGDWWPVVLIIIGVAAIVIRAQQTAPAALPVLPGASAPAPEPARRRQRLGGGVFLIALGLAFLLSNFIGRGSVAALVLIAIGLAILVNRYW